MGFYSYFQSHDNNFWSWEEDTEVVAIPDGNTIAYKRFLIDTIEKLSHQGLPPFGALLLVILATNENANSSINSIKKIGEGVLSKFKEHQEIRSATLQDAIDFLEILNNLPAEYKQGNRRILLFQTLFESCHKILGIKRSKAIVRWINGSQVDPENIAYKGKFSITKFISDMHTIEVCSQKFPTTESILEAIAEVPEIEEPQLSEELSNEQISFEQELSDFPSTFHVGSLIKHLWGALNVPYNNVVPSDQPLGGISDLTNKGDFDKLLISEFANDELIFLSRLANNEALFIQREVPPSSDQPQRVILIDVSIRNWGTPKTLAFAILLAIATHPKTTNKCDAYILGKEYQPIQFGTVHEVVDSLQKVDHTLNCAEGLEHFLKDHDTTKNLELFFISSKDAINNSELQKVIFDYYPRFRFWINTGHAGEIELYKNQNNTKKHIQTIKVPLERLWKRKNKVSQIENIDTDSKNSYPILYPKPNAPVSVLDLPEDNTTFIITREKKIFKANTKELYDNQKGIELIWNNLPRGAQEYVAGKTDDEEYVILIFVPHKKIIQIINLNQQTSNEVMFGDWKSGSTYGFIFLNNNFYYRSNKGLWEITLSEKYQVHKLEDIPEDVKLYYFQKNGEGNSNTNWYSTRYSILKNVRNLFINGKENLVFNTHELSTNGHGVLKLDPNQSKEQLVEATYNKNTNAFVFPDNSQVLLDRSGIFILKSSNPELPDIYVPSALDSSIAAATQSYFGGNPYYYFSEYVQQERTSADNIYENFICRFTTHIVTHGS